MYRRVSCDILLLMAMIRFQYEKDGHSQENLKVNNELTFTLC